VTNVNRVDGGYALRTPVDAIQEFRILTETAPAEYGGPAAPPPPCDAFRRQRPARCTLRIPTQRRAGRAQLLCARRRTAEAESVRHGARRTVAQEQDFFFGYYEGFRNVQGVTQSATVPSDAERNGDFSGLRIRRPDNRCR